MSGHGDDLMWDGLACPPLEDYAFNFDTTTTCAALDDLLLKDDFLDNPLLDIQEDQDMVAHCFNKSCETTRRKMKTKPAVGTHYPYGKGKVLKILAQVLPLDEKHSRTSFVCLPKQPKDRSRLDHTHHVVRVDDKKKADYDDLMRTEGLVSMKPVQGWRGAKVNDDNYTISQPRRCGNHGKGKELRTAIQAMNLNEEQIKAILGETQVVVDNRAKKRKFMDCYGAQPMQRRDVMKMDNKNQLVSSNKRKAENHCQPMQRKAMDHTNQCAEGKKTRADYNSRLMQQNNKMRLDDQTNDIQTALVENKRIADYESRFEASRQMFHEGYKQAAEAKQKRHIQVIDFQKPEKQQPGSKGKANGKPSLRQKLMAMGTRKSNKKFPPYKMLSSCN